MGEIRRQVSFVVPVKSRKHFGELASRYGLSQQELLAGFVSQAIEQLEQRRHPLTGQTLAAEDASDAA